MIWIKIQNTLITSLVIWDHLYEPYQTIIFRFNHQDFIQLIYYFKTNTEIVAFQDAIKDFRTDTEEERMFQISRIGLAKLETLLLESQADDVNHQSLPPISSELYKLFEEAFMSSYAID